MISSRKESGYDDFILKELERIGLLIRALLGKEWGKENEILVIKDLCKDLPYSDDDLLNNTYSELLDKLSPEKGFNPINIELLADVFAKAENSFEHIQTAVWMYEIAEKKSSAFSFTLHPKLELSRALLERLK